MTEVFGERKEEGAAGRRLLHSHIIDFLLRPAAPSSTQKNHHVIPNEVRDLIVLYIPIGYSIIPLVMNFIKRMNQEF